MTDITLFEGEVVDLEKRPKDDGLEEDFDVVLSGGTGGLSASVFCICESTI